MANEKQEVVVADISGRFVTFTWNATDVVIRYPDDQGTIGDIQTSLETIIGAGNVLATFPGNGNLRVEFVGA